MRDEGEVRDGEELEAELPIQKLNCLRSTSTTN
jgi:hypothetical protein